jgi:hypothetical protein
MKAEYEEYFKFFLVTHVVPFLHIRRIAETEMTIRDAVDQQDAFALNYMWQIAQSNKPANKEYLYYSIAGFEDRFCSLVERSSFAYDWFFENAFDIFTDRIEYVNIERVAEHGNLEVIKSIYTPNNRSELICIARAAPCPKVGSFNETFADIPGILYSNLD